MHIETILVHEESTKFSRDVLKADRFYFVPDDQKQEAEPQEIPLSTLDVIDTQLGCALVDANGREICILIPQTTVLFSKGKKNLKNDLHLMKHKPKLRELRAFLLDTTLPHSVKLRTTRTADSQYKDWFLNFNFLAPSPHSHLTFLETISNPDTDKDLQVHGLHLTNIRHQQIKFTNKLLRVIYLVGKTYSITKEQREFLGYHLIRDPKIVDITYKIYNTFQLEFLETDTKNCKELSSLFKSFIYIKKLKKQIPFNATLNLRIYPTTPSNKPHLIEDESSSNTFNK